MVMIPSELCIHCHAGGGCTPRAAFHPVIADIADEQVDGSVHGSGRGFAFAGGEERNHLAGLRGIGGAVDLIDPFALRTACPLPAESSVKIPGAARVKWGRLNGSLRGIETTFTDAAARSNRW